MISIEDTFLIKYFYNLVVDAVVGCNQSFGSLLEPVECSLYDFDGVQEGMWSYLQKGNCKRCEFVVMGKSIERNDVPLFILQHSSLFHEVLSYAKVTAFSISFEIFLHLGQDEHKKRRILLRIDIYCILSIRFLVDFEYFSPNFGSMLPEVLGDGVDRLMELSKPAEHVVEVAVIDVILSFEVYFELINRHVLRSILHYLEDLHHVVLSFLFLAVVYVVVSIIKENQLEILNTWIHLQKLHLLFVSALDTLRIQVRTIVPLKAVGM